MSKEYVYGVPTSMFHAVGQFQGLTRDVGRYMHLTRRGLFKKRADAEQDPSFKQIIPYIVVLCGATRTFLSYWRVPVKSQEARLHGLRSIGLGGHITIEDDIDGNPLIVGARRELDEEAKSRCEYPLSQVCAMSCVGFLNDDNTPVGRVHLGVLYAVTLPPSGYEPGPELHDAKFISPAEAQEDHFTFETWSQYVIDDIREKGLD